MSLAHADHGGEDGWLFFGGPVNRRAVRRESDVERLLGTEVCVLPEIAEIIAGAFEAQLLPRVVKRLWRGVEIEYGDV